MEVEALRARALHLGKASVVLDSAEEREVCQLGGAIGDMLREKWECLLAHAVSHRQPIAVIYGSDGWGAHRNRDDEDCVRGCIRFPEGSCALRVLV